jgi:hypothetical protein
MSGRPVVRASHNPYFMDSHTNGVTINIVKILSYTGKTKRCDILKEINY